MAESFFRQPGESQAQYISRILGAIDSRKVDPRRLPPRIPGEDLNSYAMRVGAVLRAQEGGPEIVARGVNAPEVGPEIVVRGARESAADKALRLSMELRQQQRPVVEGGPEIVVNATRPQSADLRFGDKFLAGALDMSNPGANASNAEKALYLATASPLLAGAAVASGAQRGWDWLFATPEERARKQAAWEELRGKGMGNTSPDGNVNPFSNVDSFQQSLQEQLLSAFGGGASAGGGIGLIGPTPQMVGLINSALGALGPRQDSFEFQGQPMPKMPEMPRTDFDPMMRAIEMLKPEEFAEDVERRRLAMPYFLASISQAVQNSDEMTPIGTLLFRMGMGALNAPALVDEKIRELRNDFDKRQREYVKALAQGEQIKAAQLGEEARQDAMAAFEHEWRVYGQSERVSVDGETLIREVTDPNTGLKRIYRVRTPDAISQANVLLNAAQLMRPQVVSTGGGGGGRGLPDFVLKDIYQKALFFSGLPPATVRVMDFIASGSPLEALGLGEKDIKELNKEVLKRTTALVGPLAPPQEQMRVRRDVLVNVLSDLVQRNPQAQKQLSEYLNARGVQPGSSYAMFSK